MTNDQLDALEAWIIGIIQREGVGGCLHETIRCYRLREAVETVFGLKDAEQ